ncbi:MAG TPA: hypothetical protein VG603_15025 [Chitinophagales bacterium]|nr:hypothetical protein [Chitinophagales bacterium]
MSKPAMLFLWILFSVTITNAQAIAHGHAHNDYQHKRPLFEALESGFTSIEIDVFLHHNDLIVSHDCTGLNNKPDIEELYLKPIKKVIGQNGGWVYKGYNRPVIFMIDMKTNGDLAYAKLKEILDKYKELFCVYQKDSIISYGPLEILISGSKPYRSLINENTSYATIDADISDIDKATLDAVVTRYSDPWHKYFKWKGNGEMPEREKAKLDSLVAAAHRKKKDIRFYAIPDKPEVWKLLLNEHVDWINTDRLKEFNEFMKNYKQ